MEVVLVMIIIGIFACEITETICDYKLKKKIKIEKEKYDADK